MVDQEVENILLEIRERVRAQELPPSGIVNSATENGAGESSSTPHEVLGTSEALGRIDSYLTVTSRAWDRLPPLLSNRSGGLARLELWLKQKLKRTTHWFTWEQINFNAAVHQALQDMLEVQRAAQSDYEQALEKLRAESGHRTLLAQNHDRLMSQGSAIEAQRAQIEAQRSQMNAQRAQIEAQRGQINARLSELTEELRERDARLHEEQRVCFKQLSLEATEAGVLEDRARRKTETLLEELRLRVEQMEKSDE